MTSVPTLRAIPVLAFHAIGAGRGPLWTPTDTFARMVDAALSAGFTPVRAQTVAEIVRGEMSDASATLGNPIAITFDDGYTSVLEQALPILASRRIPATLFAVTGAIHGVNDWDRPGQFGGGLPLLDRHGLGTLAEAGWEIGLHTHTHRRLCDVAADAVVSEFERGQETLATFGHRATTVAYPYGDSDEVSRSVVRTMFVGGFGIGARFASVTDDPARIERIESWYLRRPSMVRRLNGPSGRAYVSLRRELRSVGRWARRRDG